MALDLKNIKLDEFFVAAGKIQAPAPPKDYEPPTRDVLTGREVGQLRDVRLPRIKGEPQTIVSFLQAIPSGGYLIEEAIDTRFFNAVNVHVSITGSSPSITLAVQGGGSGNYITLTGPNTTVTLTQDASFDVMVGTASVKIYVSALSGTFTTGQGVTITVTPYFAAGPTNGPGAPVLNTIDGSGGPITDTTKTTVIAAQTNKRIWVTQITVSNTSSTATMVEITGLDSGNTYWIPCPASTQGAVVTLPTPLKGAVGTAISATCQTTASNTYVSASGYVA